MKRSLRYHRNFLFSVLLLASGGVLADIIVLNSGDRIDGKIVSEDAGSITVEYQLTPKIKDKKTIQKTDIKELTRFTPAQVEMQDKGLRKHATTPDLLSASEYESIIQDSLRTFVARFPGTPEAEEVEKMIKTLSEEKTKVLSGQVKMEGKWLDEATAKREKYNIEAYRLRLNMKAKMADFRNDPVMPKEIAALREFDALRTSYPASLQFLQVIPEALEILDKYDARLRGMAAEFTPLKADRDKALKSLTGPDLDRFKGAVEQEERAFKTQWDSEVKAKMKWRSVYKYDLKSITDAQTAVAKERTDLKNLNLVALQNEIENLNAAIRYIADGNAAEAESVMGRLRPTKNTLLNKKVFDEYDKKLKELQVKMNAQAKAAKAAAGSTAPAAGSEQGPDSANPLGDILKKKDDAKAKDEAKKAEKAKAAAEAAANKPASPTTVEPEEETMLQKINSYIPFIGGGLLVVLIIAMVMGKKKKDDDE